MSQKKQMPILRTGNSCRSIMAEALISAKLDDCIKVQSSSVKASGAVNPHAESLLKNKGYWRENYHSKVIKSVLGTKFDLIVTVCDHAKETCPMFPHAVKTIHLGFDDPSGKEVIEYEKTLQLIEESLFPIVKLELCD